MPPKQNILYSLAMKFIDRDIIGIIKTVPPQESETPGHDEKYSENGVACAARSPAKTKMSPERGLLNRIIILREIV